MDVVDNDDHTPLQPEYLKTARLIQYFLGTLTAFLSIRTVVYVIMNRQRYHTLLIQDPMIIQRACSSLQSYNIIGRLLLNTIRTLIIGASNYLQQPCTSPATKVTDYLPTKRDIQFASNMPGELFRRKEWKFKLLWVFLILTSTSIHVLLNATIGYQDELKIPSMGVTSVNATTPPIIFRNDCHVVLKTRFAGGEH